MADTTNEEEPISLVEAAAWLLQTVRTKREDIEATVARMKAKGEDDVENRYMTVQIDFYAMEALSRALESEAK